MQQVKQSQIENKLTKFTSQESNQSQTTTGSLSDLNQLYEQEILDLERQFSSETINTQIFDSKAALEEEENNNNNNNNNNYNNNQLNNNFQASVTLQISEIQTSNQQKQSLKRTKIFFSIFCAFSIILITLIQITNFVENYFEQQISQKNKLQIQMYKSRETMGFFNQEVSMENLQNLTILDAQFKASHNSYQFLNQEESEINLEKILKQQEISIQQQQLDELYFKSENNLEQQQQINVKLFSLSEQLNQNKKFPYEAGCYSIELDLIFNQQYNQTDDILINTIVEGSEWEFSIGHQGAYDVEKTQLKNALSELRTWNLENQDSDLITVIVDLKPETCGGNPELYAEQLDSIIAKYFGTDNIFTPSKLQGNFSYLLDAVQETGYPSLVSQKGKFQFVMSGYDGQECVKQIRDSYINKYENSSYSNRKNMNIFVDIDARDIEENQNVQEYGYENKNKIFYNQSLRDPQFKQKIQQAQEMKYVTRAWTINSEKYWQKAQRAGVNFLATNAVVGFEWTTFQKVQN